MAQFMLLLHEAPVDFSQFSAEDIQHVVGEYVAWRHKVAADGNLVGGEKLKDEGGRQMVMQDGNLRVTDGPFAEAKEVIGGFFAIKADDYDHAVEIAGGCPHLKYGGRIEVRQVEEVH